MTETSCTFWFMIILLGITVGLLFVVGWLLDKKTLTPEQSEKLREILKNI